MANRGEIRDGAKRPREAAPGIRIAIFKPIEVRGRTPDAATGYFPVRSREVRSVVERAEGIFAGRAVAGFLVVHGVDRSPR